MSFHRRYYSWKEISNFARINIFDDFDNYILKADSRVFEDEKSKNFVDLYCKNPEKRKSLYGYLHSPTGFKNLRLGLILNLNKIKNKIKLK